MTGFMRTFRSLHLDVASAYVLDTPLEVCEQRDPKGLYKRARAGEITNFTGIDSEYQPPEAAELHIRTTETSPEQAVEQVLGYLEARGVLG